MALTLGEACTLATGLLQRAGFAADKAQATARAITLADAWGLHSHGLLRLPHYLDRAAAGGYSPEAELTTRQDTGPLIVFDGGGSLGHWQLTRAAVAAAERAAQYGVAVVGVGNSGHSGALGVYACDIAQRGHLGLVFSDGPAVMPPWGGTQPVLSTSPIAAGIPLSPKPAVVDLALSTVARGKIAAQAKAGTALPEGWALDGDGHPTTDPAAALRGMLAPLGGAKGYALAFLVEALTAGLIGPGLSADSPDFFDPQRNGEHQRIAHLLVVLDPSRTDVDADPEAVQQRLADLATRIERAGGRVPGERRPLPEDLPDEMELSVDPAVQADLEDRARLHGIEA